MTSKRAAAAISFVGIAVFLAGVAMVYPPAAVILGGGALAAFGLFGADVDGGDS